VVKKSESPSDRADVRRRALGLLARREYGVTELARRLTAKGVDAPLAEEVAGSLAADGLASDRRFAEAYVRSRAERGWGPLAIDRDLRQRGLAAEVFEEALGAFADGWAERLEAARAKRFGAVPRGAGERAKQARFLEYRGFPGDLVHAALRRG
jgi:regulatory protein